MAGKKTILIEDYIGKVYGYLTILCEVEPRHYNRYDKNNRKIGSKIDRQVEVKCVCGKIYKASFNQIRQGTIKSCGCRRLELKHKNDNFTPSAMKMFYTRYRTDARVHDREFLLSYEEFSEIITSPCHYCGNLDDLGQRYRNKMLRQRKYSNSKTELPENMKNFKLLGTGVDRIDSTRGYEKSNVVSCCARCNEGKMDLSKEQFLNWIKKVYEHTFT